MGIFGRSKKEDKKGGVGPAGKYKKQKKTSVVKKQDEKGGFKIPSLYSRKTQYKLATDLIPGSKERITKMRNEYSKYLKGMDITPSKELEDTENLFNYFDKQAFEKNLKPSDAGKKAPMSYGDFVAEKYGAPSVKYAGNVGNLEKIKNADGTYSYKEKTGDGGQAAILAGKSSTQLQKDAVKKAPAGPTIGDIAKIEETEEQRLLRIKRKGRKATKLLPDEDELTLSTKALLG